MNTSPRSWGTIPVNGQNYDMTVHITEDRKRILTCKQYAGCQWHIDIENRKVELFTPPTIDVDTDLVLWSLWNKICTINRAEMVWK